MVPSPVFDVSTGQRPDVSLCTQCSEHLLQIIDDRRRMQVLTTRHRKEVFPLENMAVQLEELDETTDLQDEVSFCCCGHCAYVDDSE